MRNKLLTGITTVVAAAAIAAPAQAQIISPAPAATNAPAISAGTCKVRYSRDSGKVFTYAQCAINVDNIPVGQTVKVNYKSNLKTFNPHSEIGPFNSQSGSVSLSNQGGLPGQTAGTTADLTRAIQIAFPGNRVAYVKKNLKVFLSSATAGAIVTDPIATA